MVAVSGKLLNMLLLLGSSVALPVATASSSDADVPPRGSPGEEPSRVVTDDSRNQPVANPASEDFSENLPVYENRQKLPVTDTRPAKTSAAEAFDHSTPQSPSDLPSAGRPVAPPAASTRPSGNTETPDTDLAQQTPTGSPRAVSKFHWKKRRPKEINLEDTPGQWAGAVAGEIENANVKVIRVLPRRASEPLLFVPPAPSSPFSMPTRKKQRSKRFFFFRRSDPRPPGYQDWSLLGDLAGPCPVAPPTIEQFAAALNHDLPAMYNAAVAGVGGFDFTSPAAGDLSCSPSAAQLRSRFAFFSKRPSFDSQTLSSSIRRTGSVSHDSRSRTNSLTEASGISSGSLTPGRDAGEKSRGGRGNVGNDSKSTPEKISSFKSSLSANADEMSSEDEGAVDRRSMADNNRVVWMPSMTFEEQRLTSRLVVEHVISRYRKPPPAKGSLDMESAFEATQYLSDISRLSKGILKAEDALFAWRDSADGGRLQVETTFYVPSTKEDSDERASLREALEKLRGMLWVWKRVGGTTMQPWKAAAVYHLHLPLDVHIVEKKGPLLPTNHSRVVVNAFLAYEVLVCTLRELVYLGTPKDENQRKLWHLTRLFLTVQIVNMLNQLSANGISVRHVTIDTLALTGRGAVVLTDAKPEAAVHGEDAQVVARLLYQIWCTGSEEYYDRYKMDFALLTHVHCDKKTPSVIMYAMEALIGVSEATQMSLHELRSSAAFLNLAASLPIISRNAQ